MGCKLSRDRNGQLPASKQNSQRKSRNKRRLFCHRKQYSAKHSVDNSNREEDDYVISDAARASSTLAGMQRRDISGGGLPGSFPFRCPQPQEITSTNNWPPANLLSNGTRHMAAGSADKDNLPLVQHQTLSTKPLGQTAVESDSQLDFFRMLDEKIAQGRELEEQSNGTAYG